MRIVYLTLRWIAAGSSLATALYCANLTLYHAWAASGPPTPNPQWHLTWASRFLWITIGLMVAAIAFVWSNRPTNWITNGRRAYQER